MAQIKDITTGKTNPRSSLFLFLGCFGVSGKVRQKKPPDGGINLKPAGSRRKVARCFSWSRFRMKKSHVKPVVVVVLDDAAATVSEKPDHIIIKQFPGHDNITSTKINNVPAAATSHSIPAVASDHTVHDKPEIKAKSYETAAARKTTHEARKNGSSHPGSPEKKSSRASQSQSQSQSQSRSRSRTITMLSHTASFPRPAKQNNKQAASTDHRHTVGSGGSDRLIEPSPVVGLSIIMVTLVIMLVWGRLCAILCTSAWFYFVPRLTTARMKGSNVSTANGSNHHDHHHLQKESDLNKNYEKEMEYKKKVVLKGFLERNHQNTLERNHQNTFGNL